MSTTATTFSYVTVILTDAPRKITRLIVRSAGVAEQRLKAFLLSLVSADANIEEPHQIDFQDELQMAVAIQFDNGQGVLHK